MSHIIFQIRLLTLAFFLIPASITCAQPFFWQKIFGNVSCIDMAADRNNNIYVSGSSGGFYIWISSDHGMTWTKHGSGTPLIRQIAIDTSGILWGTCDHAGIYKSVDAGENWTLMLDLPLIFNTITIDNLNRIWTGTTSGKIAYSIDGGTNWWVDLLLPSEIKKLAVSRTGEIYAASSQNIYKSSAPYLPWNLIYSSVTIDTFNEIVFDDSNHIYAASFNRVVISKDNGNTWTIIPKPLGKGLFMDAGHNFYSGNFNEAGYFSTDNCQTWMPVGPHGSFKYLSIDSLVFGMSSGGISVHNIPYPPYTGLEYFPLAIGNKWQFHQQSGYYYHLKNLEYYVDRDSIISGNRYFHLGGYVNDWLRYDHETGIVFIRWNDYDFIFNNFNVDQSNGFVRMLLGSHHLRWYILEPPVNFTIFDSVYNAKKGFWIQSSSTSGQGSRTWYAEGLGEVLEDYSSFGPGGSSYSQGTKMIRAILHDSTGINYYSDKKKPDIWFNPFAPSDTLVLNFNFEVDHLYTTYNWNNSLKERFVDSVLLYSYYSKGDSTVMNPLVMFDSSTGSLYYTSQYFLDTALIKDGFDFYYKIYAVDKGIVPEFSVKPDTGWYKLNEPLPVQVNEEEKPIVYNLGQNYPNPFNPSTIINYSIPAAGKVTLTIFDLLGKEIMRLVDEEKPAGTYTAEFNAENLASGIYFYIIHAGEFVQTKKMTLLK